MTSCPGNYDMSCVVDEYEAQLWRMRDLIRDSAQQLNEQIQILRSSNNDQEIKNALDEITVIINEMNEF